VRILALLLLVLFPPSTASAQWRGERRIAPHSCATADSLLGPSRGGGTVQGNYDPSADRTYLRSGTLGASGLRLSAGLFFEGRGPVAYPAPTLNFLVGRRPLASSLVARPLPPDIALLLEDTVRVHIGPVPVRGYTGPLQAAVAPISFPILPAWALALARAKSAALVIDSVTLPIPLPDLRDFEAFYRVAVCDSLPFR
jgi:hypothetical protein